MVSRDLGRTTSYQSSSSLTPLFKNTTLRTFVWVLGTLALLVLAVPQLWYPLGFDQAVYAACGDVIKHGGVAVRDCFETKQMGVMVMYAIPMSLTHTPATNAMAIHGFTLAWTAVTALVMGHIGSQLFGRTSGVVAGVLYWLIYAGIHYWSMDQAETFANLFLVLAFYKLWQSVRNQSSSPASAHDAQHARSSLQSPLWAALWAGVCIGCAAWFKNIFVLIGITLGLCLLVWMWLRAANQTGMWLVPSMGLPLLRVGLAYALGALIPIVVGVGYYALHPGGLAALLQQWQFLQDNFPLTPPLPPEDMLRMVLRFVDNGGDLTADFKATVVQRTILGGGFPFIIMLGALGFAHRFAAQRAIVLTLLAYMASAIFLVVWQGNYMQYHFSILVPPLVLLAGAALCIPKGLPWLGYRIVSGVFVLAAVGLLALRMVPWVEDAYTNVVVQRKSPDLIYRESRQAAHLDGADYLRQHTQPTDTVAIFGDAPWVYLLAERPNATRFPFINLWIKNPGTSHYGLMLQQFMDGLQHNRPAYVVIPEDNFPWPNNSTIQDYKRAPRLIEYVEMHYEYEAQIGPFLMFHRR